MLFSIVTVCYNAESILEDTILSVLDQDFPDFEYIIIDGKSSDGTLNILNKYQKKLKIISEKDNGIYDAMNKGINLANGRYLNFLNAGDKYAHNSILSDLAEVIKQTNPKIISSDFYLENSKRFLKKKIKTKKLTLANLKRDFFACHQTIFIDYRIVKKYDLNYKIKADYKWVIDSVRLSEENSIVKIDKPNLVYAQEGMSYNSFFQGFKELVKLHYNEFGIMATISNMDIYIKRLVRALLKNIK